MKIMISLGTRPEAIKLSPLIFEFKRKAECIVVSSGQHNEMLTQVLDFFNIKVDHSLNCMNKTPNLEKLSINIIDQMGPILKKEKPDLIIAQGDTMTVFITAYLAFLSKIPFIHLEGGLRTFDKFSPFPEETFRVMVSRISEFHFVPTKNAKQNLLNEGISEDRILVSGNTVVDALHRANRRVDFNIVKKELLQYNFPVDKLRENPTIVPITVHRRENIGKHLLNICKAIKSLSSNYPDVLFIWLLHKNPDVRKIILSEIGDDSDNVFFTEPLSYNTMVYLLMNSYLIMTDSGGLQEESPTFGKPVIILRELTERPEVVSNGNGFLMGKGVPEKKIKSIFKKLYEDKDLYNSIRKKGNPFGDGKATDRICDFLFDPAIVKFLNNYPGSVNKPISIGKIDEFNWS